MDNYTFFQREKTQKATVRVLERLRSKGIRAYAEEEHVNDSRYVINVHAADMDEANKIPPDVLYSEANGSLPEPGVDQNTLNKQQVDKTILSHLSTSWKRAELVLDMSYFEMGAESDCDSRLAYLIAQELIEHRGNHSDFSACELRVKRTPLIAIGLWSSEEDKNYIHPEALVTTDHYAEKEKLIAYLDSGEVFQSWLGDTDCRFGCDEDNLATTDLTDGIWLWPLSLSHYIDAHDVLLPDKFLSHVKNNNWKVPYVCLAESTSDDDAFWIDYCGDVRLKKKMNTLNIV